MNNKIKTILITSLLLLPSSIALADEGHSNTNNLSDDMKRLRTVNKVTEVPMKVIQ